MIKDGNLQTTGVIFAGETGASCHDSPPSTGTPLDCGRARLDRRNMRERRPPARADDADADFFTIQPLNGASDFIIERKPP